MSRSVHRTLKGVFGGKGKSEVDEMIQDEDEEVLELIKKKTYKRCRKEQKLNLSIDEQLGADKAIDLE